VTAKHTEDHTGEGPSTSMADAVDSAAAPVPSVKPASLDQLRHYVELLTERVDRLERRA